MDWFALPDAELARQVLQRGTAAVYVLAFVSTARQFPALLGERGLLPVPRLLAFGRPGPTLFRWRYSDRLLRIVAWTGVAVAALLVIGVPQQGPDWVPMVAFLVLWFLYLSIVNVGQTFYGFGWESLLVEAGFTVAFLGSASQPPRLIVLALLWLLFRLEFGAGLIKLRGDTAWRDLTALYYHHETQPMPGPLSRIAHLAPPWWHRLEVIGNHVAQLVAPVALFLPQPVSTVAGLVVVGTQGWLVLTGNFAWLNWITIVLGFAAVGGGVLHALLPVVPAPPPAAPLPLPWLVLTTAAAALFLVLAVRPARNLLSRHQLMNASFNRWHLGSAYGAFGSVTRHRDEIVIEATSEAAPGPDDWREYRFFGKPGEVDRRPPQVAPYHLRLDWLLWFVPLGAARQRWFVALLAHLLEADPQLLRHVRVDPFSGERPRLIRARMFRYRFTTREEHASTGAVWVRRPLYTVVDAVDLPALQRALGA